MLLQESNLTASYRQSPCMAPHHAIHLMLRERLIRVFFMTLCICMSQKDLILPLSPLDTDIMKSSTQPKLRLYIGLVGRGVTSFPWALVYSWHASLLTGRIIISLLNVESH